MKYRLLLLDIDGTMRPNNCREFPDENVAAVKILQSHGVRVAISTGRSVAAVPVEMLNGLKPDYWICASGAQVADGNLNIIRDERMKPEQVQAVMDFFNDSPYPYGFAFTDGVFVYKDYAFMHEREAYLGGKAGFVPGEEKSRHLTDMPVAAFARCHPQDGEEFNRRYPELGIRFLFYGLSDRKGYNGVDILQPDQDKAAGLRALAEHLGISLSECVAAGDGANDVGMLRASGLSYAMADGAQCAKDAADRITPEDVTYGVEALCHEVWPEFYR